ncbi:hypothetical protein FNV43_RR26440 [Rhamnella rubrinervis]|uniref:Uncharacterized protein n=1 Tax=Rhamnella rubrinervis TaxID=2594499 RepID=A0A8K0DUZ6_9ROSA|nr:hypothetical protein FNV43_RR26440 [Rhamnella rubrinervis]
MESPGSDLVVEEQLVRKNSSRGASSSSGTPRPRQADKPNVGTPIRTPSIRVDGPANRQLMPNAILVVAHRPIGEVRPTNRHGHFFVFLLHETERRGKIHLYGKDQPFKMPHQRTKAGKTATLSERGLCDPLARPQSGIRHWIERGTGPSLVRNLHAEPSNLEGGGPSTQLSEEIPEGIPLPTLEVPYLHILEGCIRLLYCCGQPTSQGLLIPADMGKLKMKISKAEPEATKKKKDKQAAKGARRNAQTYMMPPSRWTRHSRRRPRPTSTPSTNKAEEDNLGQTNRLEATKRAEVERKWSEALKAANQDRVTPDPKAEEDGQEDLEITS